MAVKTSALQALFNANHKTAPSPAKFPAGASVQSLLGYQQDQPGFTVPGFSTDANGQIIQPGSTPAAAPPQSGFTASGDPVLQAIRDAGKASVDAATGAALPQAEQALIGYGGITPDVAATLRSIYGNDSANPIIGALTDQNTLTAAQNNPYSTLAQLLKGHQANVTSTTEGYNKKNLFYSGHYGKALGDENYGYGGRIAGAAQGLQSQLAGIYGNVLNSQNQANQNYTNALPDAYNRYLQANPTEPSATKQPVAPPSAPPAAPGIDSYASGATSDPFANLNNLSSTDWAKIAALPINQKPAPPKPTVKSAFQAV